MEFVLVALVIVVLAAVVALAVTKQRSASLARRFGPEYDRAVAEQGGRRAGESELRRLEQRRREVELRELDPEAHARYAEEWRAVQLRFVDEPEAAVVAADGLVAQVMNDRGYPVADPDDRTDMVVADHPDLAGDYRAAHEVRLRGDRGEATLDDLRAGFQHYRALFDRLLGTGTSGEHAPPDEAPVHGTTTADGDDATDEGRWPGSDDEVREPARSDDTVHDDAYGRVEPEPRPTEAGDAR